MCDHPAAWRQTGPDVGFDHKPRLHSLLGQETCQSQSQQRLACLRDVLSQVVGRSSGGAGALTGGQHDGGVAVVCAADDGGDDHRAVDQLELAAVVQEGDGGRLLLLGDVEAFKADLWKGGKKTHISATCLKNLPALRKNLNHFARANECAVRCCQASQHLLVQAALEVLLNAANSHSILRPLGAAHVRHHGAQVDLDHLRQWRKKKQTTRHFTSFYKHFSL